MKTMDMIKAERQKLKAKRRKLIAAILLKVETQIPAIPEARLMFSVFACAMRDTLDKVHRNSAIRYLTGPLYELSLCGIDTEWVRRILKKTEILESC